jgi:aminoglycoside 6'-N-acetyltransferase I
MEPITIREATPGDLQAVEQLAARFYREEGFDTPADQIGPNAAALIDSPQALVVLALIGVEPAGFAVTTTTFGLEHGLIAELEDLYVLESARRHGIARGLIDTCRTWAFTQGCTQLEVVIDPAGSARHDLGAFYTRLGFADHGRRLLSQPIATGA